MLIGLVGKHLWKSLNNTSTYFINGKQNSYMGIRKSSYKN